MATWRYFRCPVGDVRACDEYRIHHPDVLVLLGVYLGHIASDGIESEWASAQRLHVASCALFPRPYREGVDMAGDGPQPVWRAEYFLLACSDSGEAPQSVIYTHVIRRGATCYRPVSADRPRRPRKHRDPTRIDADVHKPRRRTPGRVVKEARKAKQTAESKYVPKPVGLVLRILRVAVLHRVSIVRERVDVQLRRFSEALSKFKGRGRPLSDFSVVHPSRAGIEKLARKVGVTGFFPGVNAKPIGMIFALADWADDKRSALVWRTRVGETRVEIPKETKVHHVGPMPAGPFVVSISMIVDGGAHSWRVGRVGLVPIVARTILMPLDSDGERRVALVLLRALHVVGLSELRLERRVAGEELDVGAEQVLPDFVIVAPAFRIFVEVRGNRARPYLAKKNAKAKLLVRLGDYLSAIVNARVDLPHVEQMIYAELMALLSDRCIGSKLVETIDRKIEFVDRVSAVQGVGA